jgi:hypothetical protein
MDVIFKHSLGVSGFIIGLIMLTLTYFEKFGMSSNLRSMYDHRTGKRTEFLISIGSRTWNLVVLGAMLGGFVAVNFMSDPSNVSINPKNATCNIWYRCSNGKLAPEKLLVQRSFNL